MGHTCKFGAAIHETKKVNFIILRYLEAEIHFKSAVKIKKDAALFNLWGLCLRNLNDTRNA